MNYIKKEDFKLGQIVAVPINGEFMQEEQICQKYEVVLALKSLTKPGEQIVASGEEPMPELIEAVDDMAFKTYNL